ncbi:hypothetical protein LTR94_034978, partial [Friedmanniomyces endolithicus]
MQADSKLLTVSTALRAGDQFSVTPGNGTRAVTVTIAANETLDSLAKKISSASNRQLNVTVATDNKTVPATQTLKLEAASGKQGASISAGAIGKDALSALGLTPGFI